MRAKAANLVESAEGSEFRGFGVKFWCAAGREVGRGVIGDAGGMHVFDFRHRQRLVCLVSFRHRFANAHADVNEEGLHMVGYGGL